MRILILLVVILLTSTSQAESEGSDLSKQSLQQCNLEEVLYELNDASETRENNFDENIISTTNDLKKIISKATIENKPIGEQLSPEDNDKFGRISQRLQTIQAENLVESSYQRDLKIIENLAIAADSYYRWNKVPDAKDQNSIYFALLLRLRGAISSGGIASLQSENCNLDYALFKMEDEPIKKFNNFPVKKAINQLNEIYSKYNMTMKEFDYSKLNDEDKKMVSLIGKNVISPAKIESVYIDDLENIRRLSKMVTLIYESYMNDIIDSGGNVKKFGETLQNKINHGELSDADIMTVKYLDIIDEKIPSTVSIQWRKMLNNRKLK